MPVDWSLDAPFSKIGVNSISVPWPPCDQVCLAYRIDTDICETAGELWRTEGEQFAFSAIGDPALGLDLMLETAVKVTRHRASSNQTIANLKSYIRKSFSRLIQAEHRRGSGFVTIVDDQERAIRSRGSTRCANLRVDSTQERDAYINEMKQHMDVVDERLRTIFELRAAGYTVEEIAPQFAMKPNHLRSWFSKKMGKLKNRVRTR